MLIDTKLKQPVGVCTQHITLYFTGLLNNYLAEALDTTADDIEVDQPSQEDDAGIEDESSSTMLHNCLTAIVDTLAANSPK